MSRAEESMSRYFHSAHAPFISPLLMSLIDAMIAHIQLEQRGGKSIDICEHKGA
jgi:hypothetical protein